jgi:hypothetical protein
MDTPAMLWVNKSPPNTTVAWSVLGIAGKGSVDGVVTCPDCAVSVVSNHGQNQGETKRKNGHTVLAMLFASDFELVCVVALDLSLNPSSYMCSYSRKVQHDHVDGMKERSRCTNGPMVRRRTRIVGMGHLQVTQIGEERVEGR